MEQKVVRMIQLKRVKSDAGSILLMIMIVFVLGIIAWVGALAWKSISTELRASGEFQAQPNSVEAIEKMDTFVSPLLDLFVTFVFIGFLLFLIISSAVIDAPPVLVAGFVLAMLIGVFISAQYAEAFFEFKSNEEIQPIAEEMPMSGFILGKAYPSLIAVTGFICMIVLYSRPRSAAT